MAARLRETCKLINEYQNNFTKAAIGHCLLLDPSKENVILYGSNHNRNRVFIDIDLHINSVNLILISEEKIRFHLRLQFKARETYECSLAASG